MATLNSIEIPSSASGTYESLTLQTAGTWYIKPRCQKYKITARLSEGADSVIAQVGSGIGVEVTQGDAPLTIYLQADCDENTTAVADYSDCFFVEGVLRGGGSTAGLNLTFNAPLNLSSGNVTLDLANDLQVLNGNLTLKLTSNSDFLQLSQLVQSLSGGIEWMGKSQNTNAQVSQDHTLLTTYIQTISGRAPKVGDLVLTADTPPYGWIYTNTYDAHTGQVTGQDWETIGTTAVNIATQNTVGLVKGSDTININIDGSANLNFGALFYQPGQSIPQGQWRLSPIAQNP